MKKRKVAALFENLCCSVCKSDFDEKSVIIMREEDDLIVFRLVCQKCGKSFGVAFLGINDFVLKNYIDDDLALEIQDGENPITVDDVLDAHKFIKKLDKDWQKFLNDNENGQE